MSARSPYQLKYMWGSKALEDELRQIENKIRQERNLNISIPMLTHQLALDIKKGNINFEIDFIRFRKQNRINYGNNQTQKIK